MPTLHDLSFDELTQKLTQDGINPTHAKTLWRALQHRSHTPHQILSPRQDFLPPLQRWLQQLSQNTPQEQLFDQPQQIDLIPSSDGLTHKFLLRLHDGQEIESVLMSYNGRHTACLSTQAGCAMGCIFCATGQRGFSRHLRTGEILAQIHHIKRFLAQHFPDRPPLRNLVLMGMGEPLHNYNNVLKAMHIAADTRGLNIGPSHIAISTVGLIPQILRLAQENQPFRLAVSLHGSTEQQRATLVPVSHRYPLHNLIQACRTYAQTTQKRIFFGWTLIHGQNDTPQQAHALAQLLQGINAHINLIPLNPTDGFSGSTASNQNSLQFQQILRNAGFPCTFRQRRGIDVAAGCGQLKAKSST